MGGLEIRLWALSFVPFFIDRLLSEAHSAELAICVRKSEYLNCLERVWCVWLFVVRMRC